MLLLGACAGIGEGAAPGSAIGYSALTRLDDGAYLFVQDTKSDRPGPRLGRLLIGLDGRIEHRMIAIDDWADPDGPASDLESACVLPGDGNEVLVAESSYWNGRFGRVFRVRLNADRGRVAAVYHLPEPDGGDRAMSADANYEGLLCFEQNGRDLIVVGERRSGRLRIGLLPADDGPIDWDRLAGSSLSIRVPAPWADARNGRSITDLHLDDRGTIWSAGTHDTSDVGPFQSVIYAAAALNGDDPDTPITPIANPKPAWTIDGFKVEGIAAAPGACQVPGAALAIATEDEAYPGSWRTLPRREGSTCGD